MKLIGSKIEAQFHKELVESNKDSTSKKAKAIAEVLKEMNENSKTYFVVNWIPEQGEDIYEILTYKEDILTIEVSREGKILNVERKSLEDYQKKLHKTMRIKLSVARKLLSESKNLC